MKKNKIDITFIILFILLIICLILVSQITIFKQPYVNVANYTMFHVITGSMSGTIEIDDLVVVKLTKDVNVNDIITYEKDGDYITHRVILMQDDTLITKGDANNSEDEPISRNQVVGKVVHIFNNVAIWIKVIKNPKVIIAVIVAIVAIRIFFISGKTKVKIER